LRLLKRSGKSTSSSDVGGFPTFSPQRDDTKPLTGFSCRRLFYS